MFSYNKSCSRHKSYISDHQTGFLNAKIIIAVLFSTLMAIFAVCIITFAQIPSTNFTAYLVTFVVDNVTTFCGLIAAVYLLNTLRHSSQRNPADRDRSFGPKAFFVWIFGIGVILQECLYLSINVLCLANGNNGFYKAPIAYRVVVILYILLQLGFISLSKNKQLKKSHIVDFCVFTIVVANVCFWLKGTVKDVANIYSSRGWAPILNNTNETFNLNGVYCFWYSPIQKYLPAVIDCTIPMQFEFQLLATIFFVRVRGRGIAREMSIDKDDTHNFIVDMCGAATNTSSTRCHSWYTIASIFASLALMFPMIVINLLVKHLYTKESGIGLVTQKVMLKYIKLVDSGLAFITLVLFFCGFHVLSTSIRSTVPRSARGFSNNVIIFTMTSLIALYVMTILTATHAPESDVILECACCTLMMTSVFYQTIFTVTLNRLPFLDLPDNKKKPLIVLCVFCGLYNFYTWFVNTFFDLRNRSVMLNAGGTYKCQYLVIYEKGHIPVCHLFPVSFEHGILYPIQEDYQK